MKIRVYFTTPTGTDSHVDYSSNKITLFTEEVCQRLMKQFWFDTGVDSIDGMEVVTE